MSGPRKRRLREDIKNGALFSIFDKTICMFFLIGALFILAAYISRRSNPASAKKPVAMFYFGTFLIAIGVVIVLLQFILIVKL